MTTNRINIRTALTIGFGLILILIGYAAHDFQDRLTAMRSEHSVQNLYITDLGGNKVYAASGNVYQLGDKVQLLKYDNKTLASYSTEETVAWIRMVMTSNRCFNVEYHGTLLGRDTMVISRITPGSLDCDK